MNVVGLRSDIAKMKEILKNTDKNWTETDEKHWEVHKIFIDDYSNFIAKGEGGIYTEEEFEGLLLMKEWMSMRHAYCFKSMPPSEMIPVIIAVERNPFKALKMYRALKKEDQYYMDLETIKTKEGSFFITSQE